MAQQISVALNPDSNSFGVSAPPDWEIRFEPEAENAKVGDSSDHQGWFVELSTASPLTVMVTAPTSAPVGNYGVRWLNGRVSAMNWSISTGSFTVGSG